MAAFARARPSGHWLDYPDITYGTVGSAEFEKWDKKIYELATYAENVRDHGAVGLSGGATNDGTALAEAVTAAAGKRARAVYLPGDTYPWNTTLQINTRGVKLIGDGHLRPSNTGGTRLLYGGTGAAIQLATDSGNAYDSNEYNGVQDFELHRISLATASQNTALSNGNGAGYQAGTYAVRDWRGGSVLLDRVTVENFEYGFWGIQSDFNRAKWVAMNYCRYPLYLGPRCDQNTWEQLDLLFCDQLWVDGARDVLFVSPTIVDCGSPTVAPVRVGSSAWAVSADRVTFVDPWVELLAGLNTAGQEAFFDIGGTDTTQTGAVNIERVYSASAFSGNYHVNYLARVGNVASLLVNDVTGLPQNFTKLIEFVGSANPQVVVVGRSQLQNRVNYVNNGTGAPVMYSDVTAGGYRRLTRGQPEASLAPNARTVLALDSDGAAGGTALTMTHPGVTGQQSALHFGNPGNELAGQIAYHTNDGNYWRFATSGGTRGGVSSGGMYIGATPPASGAAYGNATNSLLIQQGTAPNANPSAAGVLYVDSADGALKYRGKNGTVTTIAPA